MRALTLTQPWCGLVASGIKLVENRPRHMIKRDAIGTRFALHASREIDEDVYTRIREIAPDIASMPVESFARWFKLSRITSAIIGIATLDRIVSTGPASLGFDDENSRAILALGDQRRYFFGPIGYVLRDVVALPTPVPCRGWQGFWTAPPDVDRAIQLQLPRAT